MTTKQAYDLKKQSRERAKALGNLLDIIEKKKEIFGSSINPGDTLTADDLRAAIAALRNNGNHTHLVTTTTTPPKMTHTHYGINASNKYAYIPSVDLTAQLPNTTAYINNMYTGS